MTMVDVFLVSSQSNSNSTSLCLAMLNLTYESNQIIINHLSRKVSILTVCFSLPSR